MKKRKTTGRQLAERLDVSKTTVSKILNNNARPKQDTFSQICIALCHTDEERNDLIEAYTGVRPGVNSPTTDLKEQYPARDKKAEQRLEYRTREWRFRNEVSKQLHKWGIKNEINAVGDNTATDILTTLPNMKVAIECRSSFGDIDHTEEKLLFKRIKESGLCDEIYMVVPDSEPVHRATLDGLEVFALRFLKEQFEH